MAKEIDLSEKKIVAEMKAGRGHSLSRIEELEWLLTHRYSAKDLGVDMATLNQWRRDLALKKIAAHLVTARSAPNSLTIKVIRRYLKILQFTPQDVGTTEMELNEIEHRATLQLIERRVDDLSKERGHVHTVSLVEGGLARAGVELTPELQTQLRNLRADVTSKIERDAKLEEAKVFLSRLRSKPAATTYERMCLALKLACATPEDIGSSQAEIDEFCNQTYLVLAKKLTKQLRAEPSSWRSEARIVRLRHLLAVLKMSPDAIGMPSLPVT